MQIRNTVTEKLLIVFLQKLLIVCFVITYGIVPKRKGEEGEWREGRSDKGCCGGGGGWKGEEEGRVGGVR